MTLRFAAALGLSTLAVLGACDLARETEWYTPVYQTSIRNITVSSDTAMNGDTLRIDAVIEDSTDSRFRFQWNLRHADERLLPVDGRTDGPSVRYVVPRNPGCSPGVMSISGSVVADNGVADEEPAYGFIPLFVRSPTVPQTVVDTIEVTPEFPAPGDTVRLEVRMRDPTEAFTFRWWATHAQSEEDFLPVDGRLDGPVIRMVINPPNPLAEDPAYTQVGAQVDNGSLTEAASCPWAPIERNLSGAS